MKYKVSVIIEKDDFGYYGYCPELEGCQTQGDSFDEVSQNIKEAIELYLETLSPEEKRMLFSKEIYTTNIDNNTRVVVPFHSGKILHPKVTKEVFNAIEKHKN